MEKKVAVIIPFYREELLHNESVSLHQCFKILGNHTIIAIKPERLVLPETITQYPFSKITSFNNSFFANVQGYNRLMLSAEFYDKFIDYKYVLLYQLDAFVFKDELLYWCNQDFDYIGAPWMRKKQYPNIIIATLSKGLQYFAKRYDIKKHGLPSKKQFDDSVGNGGFSLRHVPLFYKICVEQREKIIEYNKHTTHHFNEDAFWGIEVNRKKRVLNIPDYATALKFAFEMAPGRAYKINNNQLPFGCHAWDKHIDFWKDIFKQQGYTI
jgi:hypothetical protein